MTRVNGRQSNPSMITFALFFTAFWIIWALRATTFYFIDRAFSDGIPRFLYSSAIKFGIWVIPVLVMCRFVDHRNPIAFLKLNTKIRKPWMALAASLLYLGVTVIVALTFEGKHFVAITGWNDVITRMAFLSISPFSEEVLFRGFVQAKLMTQLSFWKSNLITAFLFTSMHWPFWIWHNGFSFATVQLSVGLFLIGLFLGYLVRLTDSLWPSIGMHIGNNFLAGLLGT